MTTSILFACLGLFLILLAASAMGMVKTYNRLVLMKNQTNNGFSQISIQLKRRHDLIPNLVETVKSYLVHERETLEAVIAARNDAAGKLDHANPNDPAALGSMSSAEGALTGTLAKLSFVMEAYPDLKANETVAGLTEELTSTENRIAFARQAYNDWATGFNSMRQSFPTITFASSIGFRDDFAMIEFEDQKAIQEAPQVQLV